ncbi:MAG: TlpA family protein disulfide reductase [Flavobacteriales bacterium]|nr:TlpA family protein disulfide reductase [Flavobacteriales bacterium]
MSFFKKYKKHIDILFWVVMIVIIAYKFGYQQMAPSVALSELALVDEYGQEFTMKDYANKNVLINFYQSWCGPCMGEMPALSNSYQKLKGEDFVFIAISDEPFQLINRVRSTTKNKMLFLQAKQSLDEIGIRAYPTTYLLNKKGAVVFEKVGPDEWDTPEMIEKFKTLVQGSHD